MGILGFRTKGSLFSIVSRSFASNPIKNPNPNPRLPLFQFGSISMSSLHQKFLNPNYNSADIFYPQAFRALIHKQHSTSISEGNIYLSSSLHNPNTIFRIFSKISFIFRALISSLFQHLASIQLFESWLLVHKISYDSFEEKLHSFDLFRLNLNEFDDKVKSPKRSIRRNSRGISDVLPEVVDWRNNGSLSPVKTQANCRCCWAFLAVGAVEAINHIRTGNFIELSIQELFNCDNRNSVIYGGYAHRALL